jgi:hypothetical protein
MIEVYALLTLGGLGYLLSRNQHEASAQEHVIPRHEMPSMNTIYDSSYLYDVKREEERRAGDAHQRSQNPQQTGVIGNMFRDKQDNVVKSSLAGVEIPTEEFVHSNMMPFFGSSIKQNINPSANRTAMETFTGQVNNDIYVRKTEQKPFFEMEKHRGNVFGAPNKTDYYLERMTAPTIRNNERPFEPVKVGPGVGAGFSSLPIGGFQQDTRVYENPKTVDDLRVATNPKETFEGRMIDGQHSTQRGKVGDVSKNRVETFFENTSDRYFTTTGANTKDTQRPEYEVKDTSRTHTTRAYAGDVYAAGFNKAQPIQGSVKATSRQQMNEFGYRNVDGEAIGQADENDYGRQSILPTENERDLTSMKSYEGNITSLVKSIVAPLEDIFRVSRKEYTVQNARQFGHMQRTFPEKLTIKDPNDVLRTTIKETNIHDTMEGGQLKGPTKLAVYDPEDVTRTTIRQTTQAADTTLNIRGGTYKGTSYQTDRPNTTIKETTIDNDRYGNVESRAKDRGGYESAAYDAPTTQKQFLSDRDYVGGAEQGRGDGYKVATVDVPITQKQFISDNDYVGVAEASQDKKPMSYEDIYNANINELRESTLEGREPTKESAKVAVGSDAMQVAHKKLQIDTFAERQNNNIGVINNEPMDADTIVMTKKKDQLANDDRLDINLLTPLQDNPYAQTSFAK